MIFKITKDNIDSILNEGLKKDAAPYVTQYENFNNFIKSKGMKISEQEYSEQENILINKLKEKGAHICHNGKSIYYNSISPSCIDCHTGYGSATYIITLKCNRDCFFCTNKNQPLLYAEKCAEFISEVKKADESIQTRIYTNGDLVTEEIMQNLQKAGLDEIRFGLKPDSKGKISDNILENLKTAKKYIKRTMVEMPFPKGKAHEMKSLMDVLDNIGIYGINILEFLYPFVESTEYDTYAGGVPVAISSVECLQVMLYAVEKNMKMGLHYCSLENKLTSQVYHANFNVSKSEIEYFSQNDFFIKVAKGYNEDINIIKKVLQENKKEYIIYDEEKIIEFNPENISLLKDYNMELGLAYLAVDYDNQLKSKVMREYQIDKVIPSLFDILEL